MHFGNRIAEAGVFARRDQWYFYPYSRTTAGVWMAAESGIVVPASLDNVSRGQRVLEALSLSRDGVPHPRVFPKQADIPMVRQAGLGSWSEFIRGTQLCALGLEAGIICVTPYRNEGAKRGFIPTEQVIELAMNSPPEVIGRAVAQALELSS